jgi:hypothetical protein
MCQNCKECIQRVKRTPETTHKGLWLHRRWASTGERNLGAQTLNTYRVSIVWHSLSDGKQAERKGAGNAALSLTSYSRSHLPNNWHFTHKNKKVRQVSRLHQRCNCFAHLPPETWTGWSQFMSFALLRCKRLSLHCLPSEAFAYLQQQQRSITDKHMIQFRRYSKKKTPWLEFASELYRPTERPPLVGEVSANFSR